MSAAPPSLPLPDAVPALYASHGGVWVADGVLGSRQLSRGEAMALAAETPHILLGAPLTGERLGFADLSGLDLLELFAFIHPAQFVVPTVRALAEQCGLPAPAHEADHAAMLRAIAAHLLGTVEARDWAEREGAWHSLQALTRQRWSWAPLLGPRLAPPGDRDRGLFARLPEWEDAPPRPQPLSVTLDPHTVDSALGELTGPDAEAREGQRRFARHVAHIFAPRLRVGEPHLMLAEAGTGVGKTLGYLAPAREWIRASGGQVWISTFTKALQRQLAHETRRLYPDPADHARRVVVRKGRENYLCLLNLEDALQGGFAGRAAILAHLVARWAAYTRDGDMVGGDLPGWLTALFRRNGATALTDRRGECIYAGCPHFRKCFIERSVRAAAGADIVIANHALTLVQAARAQPDRPAPTRLIFDEGHHLWDAADSMFAVALTGQEAIELRRWVIGPETRSRGRRRGLAARLADIASYDEAGDRAINAAIDAATLLPADGWLARLIDGSPLGPVEALLVAVRAHVYARARDQRGEDPGYGLESDLVDPDATLVGAAGEAAVAIDALLRPLIQLGLRMDALLDEGPDWLDAQARGRIDGARRALSRRCDTLSAWLTLLSGIGGPDSADFVDWLAVERVEGREIDVGLHRHWLDPMVPVVNLVYRPAHGVLVTSATLRAGDAGGDMGTDGGADDEGHPARWRFADLRTGARHMNGGVRRVAVPSPFDYARQALVITVTDVPRGDLSALAHAFSNLIGAATGGVLGLFTSIRRLRYVHARIADNLARSGRSLLAQHVDPLDAGTLVDMFRADGRGTLLGTDALRDGINIPGNALNLVVLERFPWSIPNVLHAIRRVSFRDLDYEQCIVRTRTAQAFGRLIRTAQDDGIFIILQGGPSRILSVVPEAAPRQRMTLAEAVRQVAARGVATFSDDTSPLPFSPPIGQ